MTSLNIKDESHIHESILFGFPGRSDDAIIINYCILYAKQYIQLEKLKENKNQNTLNIFNSIQINTFILPGYHIQ